MRRAVGLGYFAGKDNMSVSLEEVREFASTRIIGTLERRYREGVFSRELWHEMCEIGLLGFTVPESEGGSGGTPELLSDCLYEFAREGRDLGLTLSWITHLGLCVKSIERYGTPRQREKYLRRLVSGEWVGATAISEPDTGAHPGGIRSRAVRRDGGYTLSGRKVYTTNGPVADLLVVVAATGDLPDGNKELTSFLVEASAPGFSAEYMDIGFLRTSPHGELRFEDIELPEDSVLGRPGEGHSEASRSALARERSCVYAAMAGFFRSAAAEVAARITQKYEGFNLEGSEADSWVHHLSALEVYRMVARELIEASFGGLRRWKEKLGLAIYAGISCSKWASWLCDLADGRRLEKTFPLDIILKDIELILVGEGLLLKEGRRLYIEGERAVFQG